MSLLSLLFAAILTFLALQAEAIVGGQGSCSNRNNRCGVRKFNVKMGNDIECETKCVSIQKLASMRSEGWTCGKCPGPAESFCYTCN